MHIFSNSITSTLNYNLLFGPFQATTQISQMSFSVMQMGFRFGKGYLLIMKYFDNSVGWCGTSN